MSRIKQLFRFTSKYGIFSGTKMFCQLHFGNGSVKVPGLPSPVYLRAGTTDASVFTKIFVYEEYKIPQIKGKNIKTIIDAGANIGLAAVYFAVNFPQAIVICIEPDAENFSQLKKNITPYKNIKAVQAGIWNTETSLSIANPSAAAWSYEVKEAEHEQADGIDGVTIDMIRKKFDLHTIDIAKIDIEGSEKELFGSGYEDWLPQTRFLIIEVHDWKRKGSSKAVFSALVQYNFSFGKKGENLIFTNQDIQDGGK